MVKQITRLLRVLLLWTIISLILQFSIYTLLDYRLSMVLAPSPSNINKIIIPSIEITKPELSYSGRYLSYLQENNLEIYDLTLKRVVFRLNQSAEGRAIAHRWLPDRDNLIYLYTGNIESYKFPINSNSGTHLFTLEFNNSKETPDIRYNDTIENFPLNGRIKDLGFSTFTNLMYLIITQSDQTILMEIDVNKNTKITSRTGEKIFNTAVSSKEGILYIESLIPSSTKKIFAVDGWKRKVIDDNPNSSLLGYHSENLYIGKTKNNILEEIRIITEIENKTAINYEHPIWKGEIPFNETTQVAILSKDKILILNQTSLFMIEKNNFLEYKFPKSENYISKDVRFLIRITKNLDFTEIEFSPIDL